MPVEAASGRVIDIGRPLRVAIAHDYLTAQGGAERFLVALMGLYPAAPILTSLYDESSTFDAFRTRRVISSGLNRVGPLRRHYRAALPLLPFAFSQLDVDADVVICSSSGWSHGISSGAPKIVYCHNPARWLYQESEYVRGMTHYWLAARMTRSLLVRWDMNAARSCTRYLANSRVVADRIRRVYGREAEVLAPPTSLDPSGEQDPVRGVTAGYLLSVGRLLPYKNVDSLIDAFRVLGHRWRLVVAGDGPLAGILRARAPSNVQFVGAVTDAQLRWLYANCDALLSAADEDFGLTPVEAGLFGRPAGVIRRNGFIDTVTEGRNGLFFETLDAEEIARVVRTLSRERWDANEILACAMRFSVGAFKRRLDTVIEEVAGRSMLPSLPDREVFRPDVGGSLERV